MEGNGRGGSPPRPMSIQALLRRLLGHSDLNCTAASAALGPRGRDHRAYFAQGQDAAGGGSRPKRQPTWAPGGSCKSLLLFLRRPRRFERTAASAALGAAAAITSSLRHSSVLRPRQDPAGGGRLPAESKTELGTGVSCEALLLRLHRLHWFDCRTASDASDALGAAPRPRVHSVALYVPRPGPSQRLPAGTAPGTRRVAWSR